MILLSVTKYRKRKLKKRHRKKLRKRKTVDDLRAIRIENANGGMHNLEDISSLNYGRGRSRIIRVNQDKQIEVYYAFPRDVQSSKDLLGGYRSDIDQLIASYNLPSGVAVQVFHEEDEFGDFKFLILAAFLFDIYDPCFSLRICSDAFCVAFYHSVGCYRFFAGIIAFEQQSDECEYIDRVPYSVGSSRQ